MIRITLLALVCALLSPATASAAGLDELDRFVGTWDSPGTLLATPYTKAGHADAVNVCAWSADHLFVICQQNIRLNTGHEDAISIYTFDEATKTYHFFNVHTSGATSTKISVAGNTITYSDSFMDKGKNVLTRTLNVWESPNRYRWRSEYSVDAGTTWLLMASGVSTRR